MYMPAINGFPPTETKAVAVTFSGETAVGCITTVNSRESVTFTTCCTFFTLILVCLHSS
jgi:hypothetical protein